MDLSQPQHASPEEPERVLFKVYLKKITGDGWAEVRRFNMNRIEASSFEQFKSKLLQVFPNLSKLKFHISWQDHENDDIIVSSDDELKTALENVQNSSVCRFYINPSGLRDQLEVEDESTEEEEAVEVGDDPVVGEVTTNLGSSVCPGKANRTRGAQDSNPTMIDIDLGVHECDYHLNVICDGCEMPIFGNRFKCMQCFNFDLCDSCQAKALHPEHILLCVPLQHAKFLQKPYFDKLMVSFKKYARQIQSRVKKDVRRGGRKKHSRLPHMGAVDVASELGDFEAFVTITPDSQRPQDRRRRQCRGNQTLGFDDDFNPVLIAEGIAEHTARVVEKAAQVASDWLQVALAGQGPCPRSADQSSPAATTPTTGRAASADSSGACPASSQDSASTAGPSATPSTVQVAGTASSVTGVALPPPMTPIQHVTQAEPQAPVPPCDQAVAPCTGLSSSDVAPRVASATALPGTDTSTSKASASGVTSIYPRITPHYPGPQPSSTSISVSSVPLTTYPVAGYTTSTSSSAAYLPYKTNYPFGDIPSSGSVQIQGASSARGNQYPVQNFPQFPPQLPPHIPPLMTTPLSSGLPAHLSSQPSYQMSQVSSQIPSQMSHYLTASQITSQPQLQTQFSTLPSQQPSQSQQFPPHYPYFLPQSPSQYAYMLQQQRTNALQQRTNAIRNEQLHVASQRALIDRYDCAGQAIVTQPLLPQNQIQSAQPAWPGVVLPAKPAPSVQPVQPTLKSDSIDLSEAALSEPAHAEEKAEAATDVSDIIRMPDAAPSLEDIDNMGWTMLDETPPVSESGVPTEEATHTEQAASSEETEASVAPAADCGEALDTTQAANVAQASETAQAVDAQAANPTQIADAPPARDVAQGLDSARAVDAPQAEELMQAAGAASAPPGDAGASVPGESIQSEYPIPADATALATMIYSSDPRVNSCIQNLVSLGYIPSRGLVKLAESKRGEINEVLDVLLS